LVAHSQNLVALVQDALDDMKARDTRVVHVSELTSITDYMVISGGRSSRHVRSIADRLIEKVKEAGYIPIGVEGREFGEWVLVDLDEVVVHIMQPATRDFYKLENLWDMEAQSDPKRGPTRAQPGG
jgi:ribosome-associated protein